MATKQFRIEAVAGVATGFVLESAGFAGIQTVMDHFYPGIFTMGCAAMQPAASAEVYRQVPSLKAFVDKHGEPHAEMGVDIWVGSLRREVGETAELTGPLNPSDMEINEAFAAMAERK